MKRLLLPLLVLAGCSMTPELTRPAAEVTLPESYTDAPAVDRETHHGDWWTAYNDPVLNTVVDSALAGNRNLAAAAARVSEMQAQFRIARGQQLPAVIGGADYARTETPSNTGFARNIGGGIPDFPDRFTNETYTITGTLAWEVDFWGRVRSEKDAALASFMATEEDLRAARMGVISEAVATYLEVRTTARTLELARRNVGLLEERVELTQDRFERGIAPSFELYAIRQEFENTRSSIPLLETSLADAEGRLGVVIGGFSGEARSILAMGSATPADAGDIAAGIPAEILGQRPDVAAAILRVEAARQGVGAARARLLPSLSLTATGGLQAAELSELLDVSQNFSNLVASLTAPLFQGGALRAGVHASRARLEQAVAAYEQTLLTAFKEVEVTLIAHANQRERLAFFGDEARVAAASLQTAESRFRRGVGTYISLLDAQRNMIRVETSLAGAHRDVALARLAVHRALGGSWAEPQTEL
ncbi:MAG: efflux transporter outer membrane subunit [Rhodothermales bacterium]|nr:efflux transporter outer membrane subunit [Rhodothermales bacterium]MBO6779998.1 efflux transporter outer membrane subunit [Rhodothermales bacterium]